MSTIQQQARAAGRIYILLGLVAPIGLMVVPNKLIVTGDATATLARIRASEGLFRVGLASELISNVIVIFLVLALYRLFKPVNDMLAKQLVVFGALVSVPIMFANGVNSMAALVLASGEEFLSVFDAAELDALAYLFVRLHSYGITMASVFWGLWLFPFGMLVIRCGFIPRVLGYLLMGAGAAYLAAAFARMIVPQYSPIVSRIALPLESAELPIMIWLLIWGARQPARASTA